jgi:hypothetical protein
VEVVNQGPRPDQIVGAEGAGNIGYKIVGKAEAVLGRGPRHMVRDVDLAGVLRM